MEVTRWLWTFIVIVSEKKKNQTIVDIENQRNIHPKQARTSLEM